MMCVNCSFFVTATLCSNAWMLCSFFTQIDGNWFFFHLEFIINKAAMNIFVQLSVQTILSVVCFYSTLRSNSYTNRKKMARSYVKFVQLFKSLPDGFPK